MQVPLKEATLPVAAPCLFLPHQEMDAATLMGGQRETATGEAAGLRPIAPEMRESGTSQLSPPKTVVFKGAEAII